MLTEIQKTPNYSQVFLATTALEDFWDTSKPIIFLGEWCLRYSRRFLWNRLNGNILPSLWDSHQLYNIAYNYLSDVYERLLLSLTLALNTIHCKSYSVRYWRIVVGPWLSSYIDVIYDRYNSICLAIDSYPNFTTIGLSEECFVTPNDTSDFYILTRDDLYNLQLYTKILACCGHDCSKKQNIVNKDSEEKTQTITSASWKERILLLLKKINNKVIANQKLFKKKQSYFLVSSYFPIEEELKIFLKTKGNAWPCFREVIEKPLTKLPLSYFDRTKLCNIELANNEFEKILLYLLPYDIPKSFVEGYIANEQKACNLYPSPPRNILSAASWFTDEIFKLWAADAAEKGTKLIGIQHGGNYGSVKYLRGAEHEYEILDIFYSWGWNHSSGKAKVKPMPASLLSGRKNICANNNDEGIMFVTICYPRYLTRFENFQVNKYIDWQKRFIAALMPEIRDKTRIRLFYTDYGWDVKERWLDIFPNISIETCDIPFLTSLNNCRIFVSSYLGNTQAEALSANKPTILFWDPQMFILNYEVLPYYNELRKIGILYNTPEDAAKTLQAVYDDVETWWYEPIRQKVLKRFCDYLCKTSLTASEDWGIELKRKSHSAYGLTP